MTSIPVTRPHLPPLAELQPYLEQIWESGWLTNNGPLHRRLEAELADYLGVEHVVLSANGTLALVAALQALGVTGEVITTPFSFVATAHAIRWAGAEPVFADIDPVTLNLDPERIEAAIGPRTTAIMPVHVYGRPCAVERIEEIARAHGLKVIYDAAHCFGVTYRGRSLLRWGDLSVLSFHATKVFNTFEGGAIVCPDAETADRIRRWQNFGIMDEATVETPGLNAKLSEVHAAMGLVQLTHVDRAIARRRAIDARYREALGGVPGIEVPAPLPESTLNGGYFPILVGPDYPLSRDGLYERLAAHGIRGRRYFWPLISDFPLYRGMPSAAPPNLPVAREVAERVLCLPIYADLSSAAVDEVVDCVRGK